MKGLQKFNSAPRLKLHREIIVANLWLPGYFKMKVRKSAEARAATKPNMLPQLHRITDNY